MKEHVYEINLQWTGNLGSGTSGYRNYSRDHSIFSKNKMLIPASSDPAFRGDPARYNPEELFLASIASCHMLWFLHLCADAGIVVENYEDKPVGQMDEGDQNVPGRFTAVTLRPRVMLKNPQDSERMQAIHEAAHHSCFIANSVNFPVRIEPGIVA